MLNALLFSPLLAILSIFLASKYENQDKKRIIEALSVFWSIIIMFESLKLFQENDFNKYDRSISEFLLFFIKPSFSIILALDPLSNMFLLLTSFIIFLSILSTLSSKKFQSFRFYKFYFIALFFIEFFLFGAFLTVDVFFFYICFEASSIPMFFMIGIWGSGFRRIKAAYYFFMYTFVGSLFMLTAIALMLAVCGDTNYYRTPVQGLDLELQYILWPLFFIFFSIKIPTFPFHIWLPEAHVEAPTEGSIVLAALLLKLGGFGFIRYTYLWCGSVIEYYNPLVYLLCITSVIYASLTALRQIDVKRIIAYSSIAHMNLAVMGIFSLQVEAIAGSIFLMLGHGVISGALFFLIGIIYKRYGTRSIYYYGGLAQVMPLFSIFFLFFSFANIGFPGTFNYIGELLIFFGLIKVSLLILSLAGIGFILSGAYSIWLYNRVCFGNLQTQYFSYFSDLNRLELLILFLFALPTLVIGIYPMIFMEGIFAYSDIYYYCLNTIDYVQDVYEFEGVKPVPNIFMDPPLEYFNADVPS